MNSAFLNLYTFWCNFLLNISTSLLTHEFIFKSCQCGAVSRITFVWLASIKNFSMYFRHTRELFLAMSLEIPHSTNTYSFVSYCIIALAVSFMVFIPARGLMDTRTSKSEHSKCFTSAAYLLAWLSPKIIISCFFWDACLEHFQYF